MYFTNVANGPVPYPLDGQTNALAAMPLVTHLRGHTGPPGRFSDLARFVDRMRQRFFAIDMLAVPDRGHRRHGVDVVRRRHEHRIDGFLLLQHFSQVNVAGTTFVSTA